MCYSAQVWQDYKDYVRRFGATLSIREFHELFIRRGQGEKVKLAKAMEDSLLALDTAEGREIAQLVEAFNASRSSALEQALWKQTKRVADAERALQTKSTQKAQENIRIGTNKIAQIRRQIGDLQRTSHEPKDSRIFPDWHAPVLIVEGGKRVIVPMRYHCRLAGMSASSDRAKDGKISGTYNARRDNLERFWRNQFGHTHGLIIATRFYENVETQDGGSQELVFTPRTGDVMLIACLWSRWTDPLGVAPDLLSFAAITDEPEPEVAAAGHDRTIINIKPEHVEAWLNPDPNNLQALYAIFDDRQHPYYVHQLAA